MTPTKIAVFTGSRSEYGLLYWLMRDLAANPAFQLQVIAGAMHYSPEFGQTATEIIKDGFVIDAKVEMLLSSNTAVGVAKSIGVGTIGFADALDRLLPDRLVILGDRYEALAIAQTALIMKIPVVHIHGGELTEGAYDDSIRHAITKMASLHFVAAQPYRQRVIQMGEAPNTVFNVGAMGLDHLTRTTLMAPAEIEKSLQFSINAPYVIVTLHPATMAHPTKQVSFLALERALNLFPDHQVIITYPNADNGGRTIISEIEAYAARYPSRILAVPSLGFIRYLSLLKHARAIVGNSSSGIIEAPAFGVPTVNIGDRQLGRLAAESVINCQPDEASIASALAQAFTHRFQQICKSVENPYGDGNAAARIVQVLQSSKFTRLKTFYDLEFSS